jgi:hypothetical protein
MQIESQANDPISGIARTNSMVHKIASLALIPFLAACTGKPALHEASLGGPKLDLEEYFEGPVMAYGQFQDLFGTVSRRFVVDMNGEWDGETLTLTEDFTYSDGYEERRVWTLTKTGDDTWSGSADGVIGSALCTEKDDTFNWKYQIDLPLPDGSVRVSFDDWMWRLDDKRVLNRAYMKKFGLDVGEVIIFFEKQ